MHRQTRRSLLRALSIAGLAGLAGCTASPSPRTPIARETPRATETPTHTPTPPGTVTLSETRKLVPDDGGASAEFGTSIAISGGGRTLLIGAAEQNAVDVNSGAAYVFKWSGGKWRQQATLMPDDADSDHRFGNSVALSADGDTALVGTHSNDRTNTYVFTRDSDGWTQQATLFAANGDRPRRPRRVAISNDGETALVGAYKESASTGAVYVFTRGGDGWSREARLTADDGDSADNFGEAIAVSGAGQTAIIGAYSDEDPNGDEAGSAYVFGRGADGWTQRSKLAAKDARGLAVFGESVAVSNSGRLALIGARIESEPNGRNAGAAYLFGQDADTWTQRAKITPQDGDRLDEFGTSVALSQDGRTALVGAAGDEDPYGDDAGSAYIFEWTDEGWHQRRKLVAPDGDRGDQFGMAAVLSDGGRLAFVGAPTDEDPNGKRSGAAYVFDVTEPYSPLKGTPPTEVTPKRPLGSDPAGLLQLDDQSVPPGAVTSLTATMVNPYLFPVQSGSVTLQLPDGWEIKATEGTTFDTLPPQASQEVAWEVAVPDTARGAYTVKADVTYATTTDEAEITVTATISVPRD